MSWPQRSSGTCPMQGETFQGGVEGSGRHAGSRGRVLAGHFKEFDKQPRSAHWPARCQSDWRRLMRNAQQSRLSLMRQAVIDPSRSPSRGVPTRYPATNRSMSDSQSVHACRFVSVEGRSISIGGQVRTQRVTSMMAECAERLHQLTSARTS